jgi:hypothetical protein
MQRDVTSQMSLVREWARTTWNGLVAITGERVPKRETETFDSLLESVLSSVLSALSPDSDDVRIQLGKPNPRFLVTPRNPNVTNVIRWNRSVGVNYGYWDWKAPSDVLHSIELQFVAFFDWRQKGTCDFEYVMVFAHSNSGTNEADFRYALIPVREACFVLETPETRTDISSNAGTVQ